MSILNLILATGSGVVVATPSPSPTPTNTTLPSIIGVPQDGTIVQLNVGIWSGDVNSFDVAVVATDGTVIQARTAVTGTSNLTLTGVAGKTLVLRVWAIGDGGETLAESAGFGPIAAASDTFIGAWAFHSLTGGNTASGMQSALDNAGLPYPYTSVNSDNLSGTNAEGTSWAMVGSPSLETTGTPAASDPRFRGRFASNTLTVRFEVNATPGIYIIHGGLHVGTTTATMSIGVYDGTTATNRHNLSPSAGSENGSVRDVGTGNFLQGNGSRDANIEAWKALSAPGGAPVEVTITGNKIIFGRAAELGAPYISNLLIFRKN